MELRLSDLVANALTCLATLLPQQQLRKPELLEVFVLCTCNLPSWRKCFHMVKVLPFRGTNHTPAWKPAWNACTWDLEAKDPWSKLVNRRSIWPPCLHKSDQAWHLTTASGLLIHVGELVPTHVNIAHTYICKQRILYVFLTIKLYTNVLKIWNKYLRITSIYRMIDQEMEKWTLIF